MAFTLDQLVIFAARSGNLALLRERVASGGSVNHVDARHGAALTEAIRVGNLAIVRWLLENGADPNLELGPQVGPLEVALRDLDPDMIQCLLAGGARLQKRTRPHHARRLEQCLRELGISRKSGAGG